MIALPHDVCRCFTGCERRDACLRYVARNELGLGTPWTERYCESGREARGFMPVLEKAA
jgi:hypothetical protein